jgi:hypothetical protein
MGLTMLVGLYTSRIILNALGASDFGVFNVVGGVVAMLGFFNSSIGTSTQRFLNVGMGKGETKNLPKIFSSAVNVHLIIGIITVIILETAGLWFLENKLVIPSGQKETSVWVFQCSVITSFITIISSPYNATIVAYEKMSAFAFLSIIECTLKLAVALCIKFYGSNKLKLYATLLLATAIVMRLLYSLYCKRNFHDIKYILIWNKPLIKSMMSFSGWLIFGCISDLLSTQGVNLLINVYFGPFLNAARAIGVQVQGVVSNFYSSFSISVNPQITKSYAAQDYNYCYNLVFISTKLIFFLMIIVTIPILLRSEQILIIWLNNIPPYTPAIVNLILIDNLIRSCYGPISQICFASGKIKLYQTLITVLYLSCFAGSYLLFNNGYGVLSAFILSIIISIIGLFTRIYSIKADQKFPIKNYLTSVIFRLIMAGGISFIVSQYINKYIPKTLNGIFILLIISGTISSVLIWFIGFNNNERTKLSKKISSSFKRIRQR